MRRQVVLYIGVVMYTVVMVGILTWLGFWFVFQQANPALWSVFMCTDYVAIVLVVSALLHLPLFAIVSDTRYLGVES